MGATESRGCCGSAWQDVSEELCCYDQGKQKSPGNLEGIKSFRTEVGRLYEPFKDAVHGFLTERTATSSNLPYVKTRHYRVQHLFATLQSIEGLPSAPAGFKIFKNLSIMTTFVRDVVYQYFSLHDDAVPDFSDFFLRLCLLADGSMPEEHRLALCWVAVNTSGMGLSAAKLAWFLQTVAALKRNLVGHARSLAVVTGLADAPPSPSPTSAGASSVPWSPENPATVFNVDDTAAVLAAFHIGDVSEPVDFDAFKHAVGVADRARDTRFGRFSLLLYKELYENRWFKRLQDPSLDGGYK